MLVVLFVWVLKQSMGVRAGCDRVTQPQTGALIATLGKNQFPALHLKGNVLHVFLSFFFFLSFLLKILCIYF